MRTYSIVLIGFGNVGQGLAQILADRSQELAERFGVEYKITAVCDLLKGSVFDPTGLSPAALLQAAAQGQPLTSLPAAHTGWDAQRTLQECGAKMGALGSLLTATITWEPCMPTTCWMAPASPTAM